MHQCHLHLKRTPQSCCICRKHFELTEIYDIYLSCPTNVAIYAFLNAKTYQHRRTNIKVFPFVKYNKINAIMLGVVVFVRH